MSRTASLELTKGATRELHVALPGKVTAAEFASVSKSIFEIIHSHTGCNCLSGVIPVVIHDQELRDVVQVNLAAKA
jgi:hypothetical protein